MAAGNAAAAESGDRELTITRVFDAPRAMVWKVWTDPDHMVNWLGPKGFTGKIIKIDARPGGSYRFEMRAPDGSDHWVQGVYHDVAELERVAYTWAWADGDGNATSPETVVTVTFADEGARTRLSLHQAIFESVNARNQHNEGWASCLDKLAEYLATI